MKKKTLSGKKKANPFKCISMRLQKSDQKMENCVAVTCLGFKLN